MGRREVELAPEDGTLLRAFLHAAGRPRVGLRYLAAVEAAHPTRPDDRPRAQAALVRFGTCTDHSELTTSAALACIQQHLTDLA